MIRLALFGLSIAAAISAQSPLTTTFTHNNNGAVGGGVYFDLDVTIAAGITITGLDLNLNGTGSVEVYTIPGTRIGNQTNAAAWTLAATGTVTGAVPGAQSPVAISPIALPPGSWGIALKAVGVAHHYTNGSQTFATAELALAAGEASNVAFLLPVFQPRTVNCSIHYSVGAVGTQATNTTLGVGCVRSVASMYESFATSAAFDLGSSALSFTPDGGGYDVTRDGSLLAVGSTSTPTALALSDDSQVTQTFTVGSFPGWTGMTICSNGFISQATGNGTAFTPVVATMLGAPETAFWSWHDYNPAIPAGGQVKYEESASAIVVTWDGVWDFGGASAASANNLQFQFYPDGSVTIAWGVMSGLGNSHLVGYSPGGASDDPGSTDISALGAGTIALGATDVLPLTLTADTRPITNTNWDLSVTNIPMTGFAGLDIFGFVDPGVDDLAFVGMPGCPWRAGLDVVVPYPVTGPTHGHSLAIPNTLSLINLHVYTQSVVFLVPPAVITSNGIDGKIGDL